MNEGTSVLLGLEDEFTVLQLERIDADTVRVVIEVIDPEGACPECGVLTSRIKERPLVQVKDLPASGQRTDLWWLKRRLVCREPACGTATFTQQSRAVPARSRLTTRLREKIGSAIASGNRAVSEVASEYQVAWSTAHRALIALANQWLPEPEPTRVLGIDETRARSVRWVLEEAGWTRSNPWMTSFVNADPTLPGHLLGLTPGRSGACVIDWLALQTPAFRAGIDLVVIDPSAPYAGGIRTALPDARIAVDKWHLVALANLMVTQVRQRITRNCTAAAAPPPTKSGPAGNCCSPATSTSPSSKRPGSTRPSPPRIRPTRSPPRMPSRNACACCWPNTSRTRSGAGCTTSTTPPPAPTWRRPPAWRPRSTRGGQRCSSRSPRT